MAESEEELKSLFMKVKEDSEKVSSVPRDWTQFSLTVGRPFTVWAIGESNEKSR